MGYSKKKIKDKAKQFQGNDSMALAASTLDKDASEEEVRSAVAEIVSTALDKLPRIIQWFISESWAAKLVASVTDTLGEILLKWLR